MQNSVRVFRFLMIAFAISFCLPGAAAADTLTLMWDRASDPSVTGYVVFVGTQSGVYSQSVDVGNADTFVFTSAVAGQRYYFAAQAYAGELRSSLSGEISGYSNASPTLTNPGTQTSTVGQAVLLQLRGADPEGTAVTYAPSGLPPGLTVSATGLITGTPTTAGNYSVTVTASDGVLTAATSFAWFVATPSVPTPAPGAGMNVAAAAAGAVAVASSTYSSDHDPQSVINGDRTGANWANGGGWNDATFNSFPDWLQVDFASAYTIDQVHVFSVQDNYSSPVQPTAGQTFANYGLKDFLLQYWTGSEWALIPGSAVINNDLVWRAITFTPITTQHIRLLVNRANDGWTRVTEIEAFTTGDALTTPPVPTPAPGAGMNVAAAAAGAVAVASSTNSSGHDAQGAINGDRTGANWANGGGWNDATFNSFPDWLQVDFASAYTIDQVHVFSVQDNYSSPVQPTAGQTFANYGLKDFLLQYWTGSEWALIPGSAVVNNTLVWRAITFTPVTTQHIRLLVNRASDGWTRVTEIEAFTTGDTVTTPPAPTPAPGTGSNVAAAAAGAVAVASSTYSSDHDAQSAINGDRTGANWGGGGGWNDATFDSFPDWLQVDFASAYTINQVHVFSVQDNYSAPVQPTAGQTFANYGLRDFLLQYWTGSEWALIPGSAVINNDLVWRAITFTPITTQHIRLLVNRANDGWTRVTEIEAFTP